LGIIDCLILLWEHRLNAGSFKALPAVQANMMHSENGQPQSQQTVNKQRSLSNLKPFTKGDRRINRKGRAKNFDAFRELAQAIAHEKTVGDNRETITIVESYPKIVGKKQRTGAAKAFVEYAFGKVPDKA
jgi:hypothetical protein